MSSGLDTPDELEVSLTNKDVQKLVQEIDEGKSFSLIFSAISFGRQGKSDHFSKVCSTGTTSTPSSRYL